MVGCMKLLDAWKERARAIRVEAYTLYLACKDPRVPWYAKAFAGCVAAYAFSPIDLIPDPIPVIGYLDDLILVPLGVLAARRMISKSILDECRERSLTLLQEGKPVNRKAAVVIVLIWALAAIGVLWLFVRRSA